MRNLKEIVHIDKRFQNSINLQLDIGNEKKINSYIPTKSSVLILDSYLQHINMNKDKANIIIGPYGKGKSHLLLVLLYLISGKKGKSIDLLIKKIENNSKHTAELAREINKKKYLPIIVSGTYKDLNQAFLVGLLDALNREKLQDIAPASYFSEAVKTINKWKKYYPDTFNTFEKILIGEGTNATKMVSNLKKHSERALKLFSNIHPKLTAGSKFNPIVEVEAVRLYKEIANVLCKDGEYSGVYIIFDEFSKYIEGHEKETFSRDMKILQDMCELASASKDAQIHITLVAHKSIKEYGRVVPKETINAFRGVEGRIKEERFVISSKNNYELIKYVVNKKKEDYRKVVNSDKNYKQIIEESYRVPCFSGNFEKEEYEDVIAYGTFPLIPLAAYCLLAISEKVAQNERSIFTFLANDDQGSLVRLIENSNTVLAADVIYNYFENMFKKNKELPVIHNEWLKAEYAISKVETNNEIRLIKTIAIMRMVNRGDEFPINKNTIRLASGLNRAVFEETITELEQKNIIVFRRKQGIYAFKNNVGIDIDNEIKKEVAKQKDNINLLEILSNISELDFVLPKQYNQEYTMTRYFRYVYMTPKMLCDTKKSEYLFEAVGADGLVVCLVCDMEISDELVDGVKKHLSKLADKRIIVILPNNRFSGEENIRRLLAVRKLLGDKEFIEENKVLIQELKIYEEDLIFEINSEIENTYLLESHNCRGFCENTEIMFNTEKEFNRYVSRLCKEYYNKTPKINNELINRKQVSTQIKKARKQIVSDIINEEDYSKYDFGTSSEATIFRATMLHTGLVKKRNDNIDKGIVSINRKVDKFIEDSAGNKNSFAKLYDVLEGKHLGVRRGVIPIFLARKISLLQDTPVIYLEDKEVEIQSEIFENINEQPENYYLYVEKESVAKEKYISGLERIFSVEDRNSTQYGKRNRLSYLVCDMQKWYRSLPQYTLNCKKDIDKSYYKFRNIFRNIELNPRETLYEKIPSILKSNLNNEEGFEIYAEEIEKIVSFFNNFLISRKRYIADEIKKIFRAKENESLKLILKGWYSKQSNKSKNHILNDNVTTFMTYIEHLKTNDELEIVSSLSKIIYGIYIDDWNDTASEKFLDNLTNVKKYVESIHEDSTKESGENKICIVGSNGKQVEKYYEPDVDDSTSYFFENAIEDALEEFGDTLEINQKISVLVKTIEKLIK